MIKHGDPPYLECSSRGDKRFSAFFARIICRDFASIEELYQSAKRFHPNTPGVDPTTCRMITWQQAKGKRAVNQDEVALLYETLWNEYITENPHLVMVLQQATGLSDMFGQPGSVCQATSLWRIRKERYVDLRGRVQFTR